MIERVLQSNFQGRQVPGIPEQWRAGLMKKIDDTELEEEVLFIKYENRFWHTAWISFAASVFIFLCLIYLFNKEELSLKQTVTKQIYEYLTMEQQFCHEDEKAL